MRRDTPLKRKTALKRTPLKARTDSSPNRRGDASALAAKTCAQCGADFQPAIGYQKYCGAPCRAEAEKADFTCEFCSIVFRRPRSRRWRYCSPRCANRAAWAHRRGTRSKAPKRPWSIQVKGESACRNCGEPANHLHHIVPRSRSKAGREDVARNGVPLCSTCHRGWHDRITPIGQHRLTDAEFAYATELAGSEWLRRNYPDPPLSELLTLYHTKTGRWLEHGSGTPEPLRRRTLRLFGVEYVPESSPNNAWWTT